MKNPPAYPVIACAAIRRGDVIICGPRHGWCLNRRPSPTEKWECGFLDQHGNFLTRAEAWKVADMAGQIRCPTGFERHHDNVRPAGIGDEGLLFSENLYTDAMKKA